MPTQIRIQREKILLNVCTIIVVVLASYMRNVANNLTTKMITIVLATKHEYFFIENYFYQTMHICAKNIIA